MPVIESKIDTNSPQFLQNREDMLKMIAEWRAVEDKGRQEEESKRERFHKRGQMLPRERVHLMLDRGSPWLELQTLCGYKMHDDKDGSLAGGNTIMGIGYVSGTRCMVTASNFAIKGGTMTPWGVQKTLRIQDICMEQKLPAVSMIESGGANLLYQAELFIPGGKTFANPNAYIRVELGREVTAAQLLSDWVLVHEMTHLALPDTGEEHAWLSEGIATYVEGVARVQAGNRSEVDVWAEELRSMPRGLPEPGDVDYAAP